ncbi:MAG: sigma-70 family RNA polymerase sigma factor [Acidobacteriota bacterium]|nr:sigma-70 family RNA polymerase sigma factor [Acidobacteriota bacterium]
MATANRPSPAPSVEEFYSEIKSTACQVFARYSIPFEDSEDLMQQALVTFLSKHETVRDPRAWTIGTLRNLCLLYWRKRRTTVYECVDAALLESLAEPERPAQERADLARDLDLLINELPDRCRLILGLRYGVGCAPKETARRLGYRTTSIYKLTERCLAALSRRLLASGMATNGGDSSAPECPGLH